MSFTCHLFPISPSIHVGSVQCMLWMYDFSSFKLKIQHICGFLQGLFNQYNQLETDHFPDLWRNGCRKTIRNVFRADVQPWGGGFHDHQNKVEWDFEYTVAWNIQFISVTYHMFAYGFDCWFYWLAIGEYILIDSTNILDPTNTLDSSLNVDYYIKLFGKSLVMK